MGDESHDDWGNGYRQQLGDGLARISTGNSLVSVSTSLVRTVNKSDSAVSVSPVLSVLVPASECSYRRQLGDRLQTVWR